MGFHARRFPLGAAFRLSGAGRELGLDGVLAFTKAHTLTFGTSDHH